MTSAEMKKAQKENINIQRQSMIATEKAKARHTAISLATFFDYPNNSKRAADVIKESEKLYQWLIKDLK